MGPFVLRLDGEGERRGLGRGLGPRRHREHVGGIGLQERGVVIVVRDDQVDWRRAGANAPTGIAVE